MKQAKSNIHHFLIFFFYDYFDVYFKGMSWSQKFQTAFGVMKFMTILNYT